MFIYRVLNTTTCCKVFYLPLQNTILWRPLASNNSCVALDLGTSKPWAWCPQRSEKRRQPFGVVVFKKIGSNGCFIETYGVPSCVFEARTSIWLLPLCQGAWRDLLETPAMVGIIVLLYFLSEMIHIMYLYIYIITHLDGLTSHVVMFSNCDFQIMASLYNFKLTPKSETVARSFDAEWLVVLQHASCPWMFGRVCIIIVHRYMIYV